MSVYFWFMFIDIIVLCVSIYFSSGGEERMWMFIWVGVCVLFPVIYKYKYEWGKKNEKKICKV